MSRLARLAAGGVAAVAWAGLFIQAAVTYRTMPSAAMVFWTLAAYFTITTNLLVALVFSAVAAGSERSGRNWIMGGTVLSIVLVGVIYTLLLHGLTELSGGSLLANFLLHYATPVLVPIFWLFLIPKGRLRSGDPLRWAIYPLSYLGYALIRGKMTGRYAYPFINVTAMGWAQTVFNALAIAAGFMLAAYALVGLDSLLFQRRERTR